jgi:hypothetical protein
MNLLTQISEKSQKSRQTTQRRVGQLPFSNFIKFLWKLAFMALLGFVLVKAYPFIKHWFNVMSSTIK